MAVRASSTPARATGARAILDRVLVPRVLVLVAFLVTAVWFAWQASHVDAFIWLIDELLYTKYAVGYANLDGLLPTVHGVRYGPPNILYPLLISPVMALFSMPTAFDLAHIIGAVVYSSTLFPTYLLARRVGATWGWALMAGLMSVWAPWGVTTLLVMTESLAYPLFVWAVLAIVLAVGDPRPRYDLLACGAILAATLARTQLVLLAAVFVGALVLDELARRDVGRSWRDRLWPHRALLGFAVVGALLLAVAQLAGADLLSSYANATNKPPFPTGWLQSTMVHAARIFVGTGLLPAVLFVAWLLRAGARPRDALERAAVVVLGLSVPLIFYQAGFFAQNIAGGVVQERYVLYAVPLIAVGAVALASDRSRPAPRLSVVAGAVLVGMIAAVEVYTPGTVGGAFGRAASAFAAYFDRLAPRLVDIGSVPLGRTATPAEGLIVVLAVLLVVTLVAFADRVRRFALPALFVLVFAFGVAETRWVLPQVITGISEAYPSVLVGVDEQPRDWVDQALPSGAEATMLVGRLNSPDESGQWLWTEFWNKRITQGLSRDGLSGYTGWPAVKLQADPATGRLRAPGAHEHVVVSATSPSLQLEGREVSRSASGTVLVRAASPLQARTLLEGGDVNGKPKSAAPMQLHVYGAARSRPVELKLLADAPPPGDEPQPLRYSVATADGVRRGRIEAGRTLTLTVVPPRSGVIEIGHQQAKAPTGGGTLDVSLTSVRLLP